MYVQYKEPNQERMAALINEQRGDRTLAEFAGDIKRSSPAIKVSASTLSRASNCGNNPVSYDLLEAIAKISDNYEETLSHLLEANGTRSQEDDKVLARKTVAERRRQIFQRYDRDVTAIIQNEIMRRGYQVIPLNRFYNGMTLNGYVYQKDRVFPRNYTFGYSVSGMSPCSTWKFMVNTIRFPEGASDNSIEGHVGNYINRVAAIFAGDSMEAELYENEKYSFVFIDKDMYTIFMKRLNDHEILVNNLMTAILVDIDKGCVIEEVQLKRYDGEKVTSFFNNPVLEEDEEIGDAFDIFDDEE